ncbi:hypothetical protein BG006_010581 [Podila minutissima]|uniref:Uncharacterized protein n=1 Tax=Podila minutissima TaxID=64525 RepID=A0A9P5SFU3_9FUNG|nr:hypothetical protein BG006_010581 [Podila minutissima]
MSIIDSTVSELKVSKDISNVDSDSESDSSSTLLSIRKKLVVVDDTEEPIEAVPEVDYETQRKRNILENQKLMLELGLNPMSVHRSFPVPESSLSRDNETDEYIPRRSSGIAHMARQQKRRIVPVQPVATRSSKRIRGEPAKVYQVDIEALESGARGVISDDSEDDEGGEYGKRPSKVGTEPPSQPGTYARVMWKGRKQTNGFTILTDIPDAGCPMTLGSISTTIWELGNIYTGKENRLKYWSGKGSNFRHPYPVGFRAEKFHFRERYTMHIKEGPQGPIFIVESEAGKVFEGASPTHPWTQACLASYSKGTRISGPLFFGFSDPITQKMIEDLEGYQKYEDAVAEVEAEERALALVEVQSELNGGHGGKDDTTVDSKATEES